MTLYVLDTDHLTLLRYGHAQVAARVDATPADQLAGRGQQIWEERKQKLEAARKARRRPTDVDKTPVDSITQLTPVSCFG